MHKPPLAEAATRRNSSTDDHAANSQFWSMRHRGRPQLFVH